MCNYASFAEVVNQALGGGESSGRADDTNDLSKAPTFEAALANINNAMKYG